MTDAVTELKVGPVLAMSWYDERPGVPVTVAIPSHPRRGSADDPQGLLGRAVASVRAQTVVPLGGIALAYDLDGEGAAATRQRALNAVETEFVSFLDSDDWLYPHHLVTHWGLLTEHDADVAYSWWGGNRPFPESTHRGLPFDNEHPHHITMTLTVRTELMKQVGFRRGEMHPDWTGEDWLAIVDLANLGAKFAGTAEETWFYDAGHGQNTSGSPTRGDGPLT